MLDSFLTFINRQGFDLKNATTLLTVSGGLDSVVMVDLFSRAGLTCGIAHCNFGLRRQASDDDELFVRQLAERYGFPMFNTRFDTKKIVEATGVSTQMAARNLRYPWFEQVRNREGFDYIATAHHANDHLETALLNLTQGTGLAGLKGIPVQNGAIIRPLLFATREKIHAYAIQNGISWREDHSNADIKYRRNFIRHQIVPELKKINPSLEETFLKTAQRLADAQVVLQASFKKWFDESIGETPEQVTISVDKLMNAPSPRYYLAELLSGYGFNYTQSEAILENPYSTAGKTYHSASHVFYKDRKNWFILPKSAASPVPDLEIAVSIVAYTKEFQFPSPETAVCIDAKLLKTPLSVRSWTQGDTFYPLGMDGRRKKVSDLLIDKKIPLFEKEQVKVLLNADQEIVWVIGYRGDHRFKVSADTEQIAVITIHEKDK